MVKQEKLKEVENFVKLIEEHRIVGLVDVYQLPASQLQTIKKELRGKALIRMCKKTTLKRVLEKVDKKNIKELLDINVKSPVLIFSNENSFKLYAIVNKNKSPAFAKAGDKAPFEIVVPAGNTNFSPGPIISELQKLKIKARIVGDVVSITEDSKVVDESGVISPELASMLIKLNIKPMEIGLDVVAVYENGEIFLKSVLAIDEKEYKNNVIRAYKESFNLAFNISYPTKENISLLLIKARSEAFNLAVKAEVLTKETIAVLLGKAQAQAQTLYSQVPPAEEKKESEKAEE